VALRRTRTALRLFKDALPAAAYGDFRRRFRELSGPTGALRDLDVHLDARDKYAQRIPAKLRKYLAPTFASLARRRDERRAELAAILSGSEYTDLKRDWRAAIRKLRYGAPASPAAEEMALPVARDAIASRYEKLRGHAAHADSLDAAALHRARVQGKRLRYVLEFFAVPLGEPATVAAKQVERLQDALGVYHDAGMLEPLLQAELDAIRPDTPDAVERAAALGAWMARLDARRDKARRRALRRIEKINGKKIESALGRIIADD
jgi:CHAD domain-containing protein